MASTSSFIRSLPSLSHLVLALAFIAIGLTLGKWLTFLFDGSTFAHIDSSLFVSQGASPSSTIMAMKRTLELMPVSIAASCVTYLLMLAQRSYKSTFLMKDIVMGAWRVAIALFSLIGIFFIVSSVLSIIDVALGFGRQIPFIGVLFSLAYGLIYPIATLISLLIILFSYFIALGPLHAVGIREQEKLIEEDDGISRSVSLKQISLSIQQLVSESGTNIRTLLVCGWCFGLIPLFIYQLFLMVTLKPVFPAEGIATGFLQSLVLSISTAVVEAPFLLLSLLISFHVVTHSDKG